MKRKRLCLVVGTHRSGTSCLATLLGSHPDLNASNHRYGEDQLFVNINRTILDDNNGFWQSPPTCELRVKAGTDKRMNEALTGWLSGDKTRVLKDPRTCVTLPAWLKILPEDEVVLAVILRPPIDSVKSLMASKAHKCKEEELARHTTIATVSAMFRSLAATDCPKTFVLYEELVRRPAEAVAPVCEMIGIEVAGLDLGIVKPDMQHHGRPAGERTD